MRRRKTNLYRLPLDVNYVQYWNVRGYMLQEILRKRGDAYARKELVSPERTVTSTVKMSDGRMLPVRTKTDIPKAKVLECVRELKHVVVEAPVEMGQIIVQDIVGTNVPVIATKKMGERV